MTAAPKNQETTMAPTKRFFVSMLTRDIALSDAILDLLDNCLDGILRNNDVDISRARPYEGYWAKLYFSADRFTIEDNCGGISRALATKSALQIGRPVGSDDFDDDIPTVGMYGIGMKRAIFKLGRHAEITSKTSSEGWKVVIPERWFRNENTWMVNVQPFADAQRNPGTKIVVSKLEPQIAESFASPSGFASTIRRAVSETYSLIIEKGFKVYVDNTQVKPFPVIFRSVELKNYTRGIAPYLFEGKVDGVSVSLAVGFHSPNSRDDEDDDTDGNATFDEAGWTIVCNDRVVVHRDKSLLTGWGEAGVPSFHNQFIGITGVVHFRSNEAIKLPLTTTKRGIDGGSLVYLAVKDKMRDGLRKFTSYTNKLKKDVHKRDELFQETKTMEYTVLEAEIKTAKLTWTTDTKLKGKTFSPDLPPVSERDLKTIRFSRPSDEIRKVSKKLFAEADVRPSEVGERCFELALKGGIGA